MQPVWIAVAILFTIALTLLLCTAIAFAYYMVLQMKKLQTAAEANAKAAQEFLGDGTLVYIHKSLRLLVEQIPDAIGAIKIFNAVTASFTKAVFTQEPTPVRAAAPPEEEGSAFFGYDEQTAGQAEVNLKRDRDRLSKEQMATMRTDKPAKPVEPVPDEILPPKPEGTTTRLTQTPL